MSKRVMVYRNNLYKISEQFIYYQAENLKEWIPVLVGKKTEGDRVGNIPFFIFDSGNIYKKLKSFIFQTPDFESVKLKVGHISLIHAHFAVDAMSALKFSKDNKIPLIVTLHGYDAKLTWYKSLRSFRPAIIYYYLFRRRLFKRAELFLCVSEYVKSLALMQGFPSDKLVVHYIGYESFLNKDTIEKNETVTILSVGRLIRLKNTIDTLMAAKTMKTKGVKFRLDIIGDGPEKKNLQNFIDTYDLGDCCNLLGALSHDEVIKRMHQSHIFCLGSVTEGLGMVLLEAASCELPLVGTNDGGIKEVIRHGDNGFLFEKRNIVELSLYLIRLVESSELRSSMGKRSRDILSERFSLGEQNKRLEEIYDSL